VSSLPSFAFIAIVGATFFSEDLTTIGVGVAVRDGAFPLAQALLACALGIYLGDIGLWAAGRFAGRRVLRSRAFARVPQASLRGLGSWINRHPAAAILASRFLPGTRLPLYVAAGIWGERPWRFFGWMLFAVALWTPLLVFATIILGHAIAAPIARWSHAPWFARGAVTALACLLLHISLTLASPQGRTRLSMRAARLRRWEFWPAWIVNAPVMLWILGLALRHRGLTVFTAANPGFEEGGFVGESKSAILAKLPQLWVIPWTVIEPGPLPARATAVERTLTARGWQYPVVAKPDVGQRGTGVRWLRDADDARRYLEGESGRVLLQTPHAGPFEAGLFYVRRPDEPHGRLFSITDKRFPALVGNGRSTIEALIHAHPRARLQAAVFLARHAAQRTRVPEPGEIVLLVRAGNHAQGTQFLDGRWLATPALEARIDEIARAIDGFYFGRFDVRYENRDDFMAGRGFAIVELNGVTSEATHIYDPAGSLISAWRTLMRQWSIAFAIGTANRACGHRPATLRRLLGLIWVYLRTRPTHPVAD
jgi:membrane protein DedA with SNARE-associated domain